jgi:colicin import membrane protein
MTYHHSILQTQLPDKRLRWMLVVSLIIHMVVFAICFFKAPGERIYYNPYANSISVDLLAPPGPPGPKTDSSQPAQQQQPVKLWKGPAKVEADVKATVERSHNVITVQKKEEDVYAPNAVKKARDTEGPQKPAASQPPAGGGTSEFVEPGELPPAGGGGGGGGGGTGDLRLAAYYNTINGKIQQAWVLPPYDKRNGKLEAIVVLKIARNGSIIGFEFEKRSGDANLDDSVARAIRKSDPLPPLPDIFRESVLEVGIRFIPDEKPF